METIEKVVVVGGSVAGLAAAAALSRRAEEVVLVERRPVGPTGTTAPQGTLPHVMLAAGSLTLEQLFPGFANLLLQRGAVDTGPSSAPLPCHWWASGAVRRHLPIPDHGFQRALSSRGLVESELRRLVLSLPNVSHVDGSVAGLAISTDGDGSSRVHGVRLRGAPRPLEATLVVDAAGRGSQVPDWLEAGGLDRPAATEVVVDLRYTAFHVERGEGDLDGAAVVVVQNSREIPRIGVALPMEGGVWQVVLGGYFGQAAPTDPAGAVAFARSLGDPAVATLLERPHLDPPARYTFRSSRRLHWERVRRLPAGLVAVGDSVASFNPIYGQGMTSALLQAQALGAALDEHGELAGACRAAARRCAKVVDSPWLTATGADFIYRETRGRRPAGTALVNAYVDRVIRAAAVDEQLNAALTSVQQMLAPPPALFRPQVVARALRRPGRPVAQPLSVGLPRPPVTPRAPSAPS